MVGDTIAAVATAIGEGGIGIAESLFRPGGKAKAGDWPTHTLRYGHVIDRRSGAVVDEVLVSVMRGPRSYTREDVVEINCHGGALAVRRVLELVLEAGARLAEPGEFTRRAFVNGRIDLAQAEAVGDVVRARSEAGLRAAMRLLEGGLSAAVGQARAELVDVLARLEAAIDFPGEVAEPEREWLRERVEGVRRRVEGLLGTATRGRAVREGVVVAIVGKPNVGKSSLLNALVGEERAIVTEIAGTTRDAVEGHLTVQGVPLTLVDTAGIRESRDVVESRGVERARRQAGQADIVLVVLDAGTGVAEEDLGVMGGFGEKRMVVVVNKVDLPGKRIDMAGVRAWAGDRAVVEVSAKEGTGLAALEAAIVGMVTGGGGDGVEGVLVTHARHERALVAARDGVRGAVDCLAGCLPLDVVCHELRGAWRALGEITGETVGEELVERIFGDFCVGK